MPETLGAAAAFGLRMLVVLKDVRRLHALTSAEGAAFSLADAANTLHNHRA
ncbi:hypothetical protein SAMN05216227_10922 [Pseudorhodobacter antarcticus]|uniref:Uncharacterized protein n=1 Tax=Pseudorhodobacter antarcticus TaxID=1077947 RepID=A0A1H8NN57_9RHOB|nr:hypothetical protein SAMN05216227_10922 [Pseudorhodobacter antarcticus]